MSSGFTGFPPRTFLFLQGLRKHNDKEWFEANKQDYQQFVLRPMQALVEELAPVMLGIDPLLEVTPAVNRTISRIHRDTRFSKDKSPFKTTHWLTFKRLRKEWQNHPAYFFELSPESYRFGMGFYCADRTSMDKFRADLDADPEPFLKAVAFHGCGRFSLEGESYKRLLKPDLPAPLLDWYNRKSFFLVSRHTVEAQGIPPFLAEELPVAFAELAPLYQYLAQVLKA